MLKKVNEIRCAVLHGQPMWPIHGKYECRVCGRKYQVPWCGHEPHSRNASQHALRDVAVGAGR